MSLVSRHAYHHVILVRIVDDKIQEVPATIRRTETSVQGSLNWSIDGDHALNLLPVLNERGIDPNFYRIDVLKGFVFVGIESKGDITTIKLARV